jgi:A nuclease of the HNH/ENDO VII superfamily with conserved LHH
VRRVFQALLPCLAILFGIEGSASGAYVDATTKNHVGVSGPNPNIHTYVLGSLGLEPQRGDTILGYDPATGVVFYVRQNPWTKFDPLGLWLMEMLPESYQRAANLPIVGQLLVPGAAVVSAIDGIANPAIEGHSAYSYFQESGTSSTAESVGLGLAAGGMRLTGMTDLAEGISGETLEFSPEAGYSSDSLTSSERTSKVVEGSVKIAGTAAIAAGGIRALGERTKPPSGTVDPSGGAAAISVKPGQTMSAYPQGRVVGGRGESPRLTDPPAGMRESGAWDPTPENLALMERGRPPVGRDGLPVELHHRNQSPAGPLDQMTSTTHDTIPHPLGPSQINRNQFGGERARYWRGEARTLNGQ